MNAYDLLFGKDTFYCIFCRRHKHISSAVFSDKGIGACNKCHNSLKPYGAVPVATETEICKTIVSIMPYSGIIRQALHDYKFNNNPAYMKVFSYYIISYVEILNDSLPVRFTDFFDLITAVPISSRRFRQRGYNQSELPAREFAAHFDMPVSFDAVKRIKDTRPQSSLPRIRRQYNVKDVYKADPEIVKNKHILLFDDIFTTGSTINSCAAALKAAGAENISAITFANKKVYTHSPDYYKYFT